MLRIYTPVPLSLDIEITLSLEASHHVVNVLRCTLGSKIHLFNAEDGEFLSEVTQIQRRIVRVKLLEKTQRPQVESNLSIHLGQAISRGSKMDYAIQKATELGVAKITPLITEHCSVKQNPQHLAKQVTHWQNIVISACEQSGRLEIPMVYPVQQWRTWLMQTTGESIICAPHSNNSHDFWKNCIINSQMPELRVLIGPEGGFSPAEILEAIEKYHCRPLSLGPRILRTETATVVALSLLQHHYGDI